MNVAQIIRYASSAYCIVGIPAQSTFMRPLSENGVETTDQDTDDQMLKTTAANTVISYVAAPASGKDGFYCYKMLIDTETYRLCFFRKHRISPKYGAGFTDYDLRSIAMTRKEKKAK